MPTIYEVDNVIKELKSLKDEYENSCIYNVYERSV